jgi:hypothetical protein
MRQQSRRFAIGMAVAAALLMARAGGAQSADKELVATISGKLLSGGLVTGVAWDGTALVIQTAVMEKGEPKAHCLVVPGPGMTIRALDTPPAAIEAYWKWKANRRSPTGLGRIRLASDSKLPMYGIASQEQRLADAMDMGGAQILHELYLGDLVIHRRRDRAPYDGEVWSWSPAELDRIAYVDEKGDVWIASADGRNPERLLKGHYTLPAWSESGRELAIAERKDNGRAWEIFVVHLPTRLTRPR